MLERSNNETPRNPQAAPSDVYARKYQSLETNENSNRHIIHAELIGSETCTALSIVAEANTPVLELCRKLIAAGHDPATRLEAYRGDVLCLRVRSIGEAAHLEINGKGCGFKCRAAVGTASPTALRNQHYRRMRGQS